MFVRLSRLLFLVAAGLVIVAGWQIVTGTPASPVPVMVVDWPQTKLGDVTIGVHELVVRVTNSTGRPGRVIGMMEGCRPNCCFRPKVAAPVAVPNGQAIDYVVLIEIHKSGPFEAPIFVYFEDNGIREVETTVAGVAVEAKSKGEGSE